MEPLPDSYREPHCRPPKVAPTLAFWGAYAAGARERDGRLPGIGPSCKRRALKRLREGGYVHEFGRRARWPFARRSAKAATRDGRLPGTRPARWPFARQRAARWPFAWQRAAAHPTLAKFHHGTWPNMELGQSRVGGGLNDTDSSV